MLKYEFDGDNIILEYDGIKIYKVFTRQIFKEIHNDLENMINCSVYDEITKFINDIIYLQVNGLEWGYDQKIDNILSEDEKEVARKLVNELEVDMRKITFTEFSKRVKLPNHMLVELASLDESGLISTHHTIGQYIRNTYRLWNLEVTSTTGFVMHPDEVSSAIIRDIWNKL